VSGEDRVEQPAGNKPQWPCGYADQSSVGDGGCRELARARWGRLKELGLSTDERSRRQRNRREGLPLSGQERLEGTTIHRSLYLSIYPGNNSVGDRGCQQLGKTNWEVLRTLSLSSKNSTQAETVSGSRGAPIWPRGSGASCRPCTCVCLPGHRVQPDQPPGLPLPLPVASVTLQGLLQRMIVSDADRNIKQR
jgi:hypothetical protein